MNLFELKEKMATLKAAILADANWLAEKAADPSTPKEDIEAKKAHRDDLQMRYDTVKAEHDRLEEEQRVAVAAKAVADGTITPEQNLKEAKGAFYRDALTGNVKKTYEGLGAIPANSADLGYGEHLLPKTVANELLLEPEETNPLRTVCRVTNITGYEEPKLGFTIEDSDLGDVADTATANEIAMTGDSVVYGRLKLKVFATVKDTVLHGTNTNLVEAIESRLRSALAMREKRFAFQSATSIYNSGTPDSVHRHMSFYDYTAYTSASVLTYAIKAVEGATMYAAIANALGDLADEFAANASVMMKKSDYYAMIQTLTNDSETLFGSKPASILGAPVIFCEKATIPVVGDFRYYGINYDVDAIYETDKDGKKGEYYFIFTAWGDQQIRLKSAFRLAIVNP
ncbi:MAG: phage major capsid protein [Oscillospiraceae bacterium]|nr:phage major capsid protein [Oscillospiraceae bacterium]